MKTCRFHASHCSYKFYVGNVTKDVPLSQKQSGKHFRCQMVNFFSITSGKLIECQKCENGKLIRCHVGKQSKCHVVNFFIDIHNLIISLLIFWEKNKKAL